MEPLKLTPFETTKIDSIPSIVSRCKATFSSQTTKPIEFRLRQLRQLYWGLNDYSALLVEACKQDLGKPTFETFVTEIDWCKNDILFVTQNLKKWMKDEPAPDISLSNLLVKPKIRKEPLGTALVIGAYNFPIQLAIGPFIGLIAAGCTGVLKPSEVSPATASILKVIFDKYLDPSAFAIVNGAVTETTALLNEKWDKIFYTGNTQVGVIIAKKAAETLTPVCLELGGINPAIITKNADPYLAARRLLWGKLMNAGQVCISQNYILVEQEVLPIFVEHLKNTLNEFYPNGIRNSPDFGRIVNQRHFSRIKKMLEGTRGKVLLGGGVDEAENYIEITVVEVPDTDDPMIVNESFGPLIPILTFNGVDEAIRIANSIHSSPLGFYPFGNKVEVDKMLNEVTSGGASVNDAFFHGSISTLAFGGVGYSGQGSYRGKASFDTFTHRRSVTTTPNWMERLLNVRYPPYEGKLAKLRAMNSSKPNFDRNCKEIKNFKYWSGILFSLGSDSIKSALIKWAAIIIIFLSIKRFVYLSNEHMSWYS
ncbi:Beta-apo-4'-carotenal oxygenase [Erysiphe necator]|uniref:Aldehyde dehydrogenase n=1 Tax=Uncinula necator TaxID=52586 RepID=A0A0B1PCW8_UNCNE|nr:Beta-apo-4'-carotenal oxygenase [Erysiphe necator]KHJ36103.1 putative fatty aldehyde dehydrogenase [Erysiphe necator]